MCYDCCYMYATMNYLKKYVYRILFSIIIAIVYHTYKQFELYIYWKYEECREQPVKPIKFTFVVIY